MSLLGRVVVGVAVLVGLASQASAQIVVNEVLVRRSGSDPHRDQVVELMNAGSSTVSLGGWVIGHQSSVSSVIPNGVSLSAGSLLVIHFRQSGTNSGSEIFFPGDVLGEISDLALYAGSSDFDDPDNLRAFIQFGGDPGTDRQLVAAEAGLWTAHAYIPSVAADHSIELCGLSTDSPTAYVDQGVPTIGQANSCGVVVTPSTWSVIKSIFH